MRLAALCLALVLLPAAAFAQGPAPSCIIEVEPLNFDLYDSFDPLPNRVLGEIRVRCQSGPPVSHVTLSAGQSGSFKKRFLASGSETLDYNIYTDYTFRNIAGDGSQGTSVLTSRSSGRLKRPLQRFVFYGEIPEDQIAGPGSYLDMVMATVVF
jgi:spore coat protein U-like protein